MFTQAELSEVRETILDIGPALTEIWPEVNYFSFSFAGVALVLPEVIKTGSQFILPDIGQPASIFWNGADAALSIGAGILMLMAVSKKLEHRRLATGFKGAVNISSGVQLAVLTGIGATSSAQVGLVSASLLGPIGFATAFGAGFLLSLDDTRNAIKRWKNFDYWLKDSLAELVVKEKIIRDLEAELNALGEGEQRYRNRGKWELWAIHQKEDRLAELKQAVSHLHRNIEARVQLKYIDQQPPASMQQIIASAQAENPDSSIWAKLNKKENAKIYRYEAIEKSIIQAAKMDAVEKSINSLIWLTAFTGMLLMCVPGMQVPASIVITVAAGLYVLKNSKKFKDKLSQYWDNKEKLKPLKQRYDAIKECVREYKRLLQADSKKNTHKLWSVRQQIETLSSHLPQIKNPSPTMQNKINRMTEKIQETAKSIGRTSKAASQTINPSPEDKKEDTSLSVPLSPNRT